MIHTLCWVIFTEGEGREPHYKTSQSFIVKESSCGKKKISNSSSLM